jgi:hypothetical protein
MSNSVKIPTGNYFKTVFELEQWEKRFAATLPSGTSLYSQSLCSSKQHSSAVQHALQACRTDCNTRFEFQLF